MTTRNLRWCGNEPSADCRRSLDRADAARAAGRGDLAARLYDETITRCQGEDDLAGRTRAVLGAASVYVFGAEPGKLSAQLYDVLVRTTDDANRARLAAALARCWSYAGQAARAVQFADEALVRAQRVDQPELLADCLDAALAAHWGPDELDARVSLATRLDDVAAHVLDPDTRLQAALWGLQVACEARDFPAMHRHMRALEHIGEESPRAQFFAAADARPSAGRTDTSAHLVGMGATAAERAALPDAWMVLESMKGYTAVSRETSPPARQWRPNARRSRWPRAPRQCVPEAAFLWLAAERPDRCRALVHSFHGRVLDDLPRDVNWLLTLQCVLEAALGVGDVEIVDTAARLLAPYAERGVQRVSSVMLHGTTDDTLATPRWSAAIRTPRFGSAIELSPRTSGWVRAGGVAGSLPGRRTRQACITGYGCIRPRTAVAGGAGGRRRADASPARLHLPTRVAATARPHDLRA